MIIKRIEKWGHPNMWSTRFSRRRNDLLPVLAPGIAQFHYRGETHGRLFMVVVAGAQSRRLIGAAVSPCSAVRRQARRCLALCQIGDDASGDHSFDGPFEFIDATAISGPFAVESNNVRRR